MKGKIIIHCWSLLFVHQLVCYGREGEIVRISQFQLDITAS